MSKKDVKTTKIKCHVCGRKFDPQNYKHHHEKCIPKPAKT